MASGLQNDVDGSVKSIPDGKTYSIKNNRFISTTPYGIICHSCYFEELQQDQQITEPSQSNKPKQWLVCALKYFNSDMNLLELKPHLSKILGIDHANIVKHLFFGQFEHRKGRIWGREYTFCLAEQYYEAGTLHSEAIKEEMPEATVKRYTRQLLSGLDYLHNTLKIIHGDIKGRNIFLEKANDVVKIGSLEMYVNMTEERTRSGDVNSRQGTWKFMSPEMVQLHAKDHPNVGRKTDIWSLGCVVLEMLTQDKFVLMSNKEKVKISAEALSYYAAKGRYKPEAPKPFTEKPPFTEKTLKDFLKSCFKTDPCDRPTATSLLEAGWLADSQ